MPTAVGPNTKGEENLVFGYDLGDVANSYKGEPTTLFGASFPTDTELPSGFYWSYEYDHQIVDAPISGHFLSNKKWIKSTRDTTGSRRVLFINNSFIAGRTYTFSCYAYSTDTRLTSLSHISHNGNYSATQNVTSYTSADIGTVKRIHGTWIQQVDGGPIFGMQTNDAALGTTFYITGLQVEEKTRATQLTGGSRSATQGLIDLTGNSTIDLTNVSFDSNAQMTFDGTNDYISLPSALTSSFNPTEFTVEAVVNYDSFGVVNSSRPYISNWNTWSPGSQKGFILRTFGVSQYPSFWWCDGTNYTSITATTQMSTGQYYHILATYSPSGVKLYVNGTVEATSGNLLTGVVFESTTRIGYGTINQGWFDGKIPIAKIYSRALTASEVQSNYNAIKGRFNI